MSLWKKLKKKAKKAFKPISKALPIKKTLRQYGSYIPYVGPAVQAGLQLERQLTNRVKTTRSAIPPPVRPPVYRPAPAGRYGAMIPAGGTRQMSLLPMAGPALGRIAGTIGRRVLPGLGQIAAGAAGGAAAQAIMGPDGQMYTRRRRRRRYITSRDISQARKLVKLANEFSCPGTRARRAASKSCR